MTTVVSTQDEDILTRKARLSAEHEELLDKIGVDPEAQPRVIAIEIELAEIETSLRPPRCA